MDSPFAMHLAEQVSTVRGFNRFYTRVVGALDEGLLQSEHSLAEARVLWELAQREVTEASELRETLRLDPGYLSRLLARLEERGLVRRERSARDGRRQVAALTSGGRKAFGALDNRADEEVRSLLEPLDVAGRRRLVGAMTAIRELLETRVAPPSFVLRAPGPGDHGWVVQRHGALYASEHGWDESFEGLVARVVADYLAYPHRRRQSAWIAEVDGKRAGCVYCTFKSSRMAQLRLLLVEPEFRGMGIGTRLVEECVRFARRSGYRQLALWTNDVLSDARRIYERAGFVLCKEEPHHSFGHDLVGQDWSLDL